MIKRTLTKIDDPGHGWLSVSLKDIARLNIQDKISGYSYMTPTRAYLEEAEDAYIFRDAAEKAGWEITIKRTYQKYTPIRNYAPYNEEKEHSDEFYFGSWIEEEEEEEEEKEVRAASIYRIHHDEDENGHKRMTITFYSKPGAELLKTTIDDIINDVTKYIKYIV